MAHEGTTPKQKVPAQLPGLPGLQKGTTLDLFDTSLDTGSRRKGYVGIGKRRGKKVARLITVGQHHADPPTANSGIGHADAILFARQDGDVTIVHLPAEQKDAEDACAHRGRPRGLPGTHAMVDADLRVSGRLDVLVNNTPKQVITKDLAENNLNTVDSTFQSNIIKMFALAKTMSLPLLGILICSLTLACPVHTPLQPAPRSVDKMEGFGDDRADIFVASAEAELHSGQIMHPYPLGD
ncbi:general stress protein 39 [Rhodofomes roseus]|uniref:General stress protein 39 n=1 Tax=Rhodofomes roseus TaxID=34475 RepID=A0ABQ8KJF0_9APHY|nr:general stress protein 39 [Rhodofomes roseus]KAH9838222.1 general stress protein 39 [Rhodofomes roseus]